LGEPVLIADECSESTAILTLNRPNRRNALTIELMESICRELTRLEADSKRRTVILRGVGPVFCAGLDLYEAADTNLVEKSSLWVAKTFETLAHSTLVTIAAAHGAAYAGGAGLMAACDFVVASDDLQICFPEVRRGLIPALVAVMLRDRLSDADLRELLLLAEPIDAKRALELGLVQRIVAAGRILAESQQLAAIVQMGGPNAVRQTKRLLREIRAVSGPALFQHALEFHFKARDGGEVHEGLAAFRERREPNWKG
jgi:methylglutaconyl-CoA hydratase